MINGHFTYTTRESGIVVAQGEGGNLMCTAGYNVLTQNLLWSFVVDQNANAGFLLTPSYGMPCYGAVGTGGATPTAADTQLLSEVARAVAYTGSTAGAGFTVLFFFGTTGTYSVTEAGVFLQATATANSGSLLDHALISPSVTKNAGQTATLSVTFTFS